MKTKLITALRTAATALENGTFAYDWSQPHSCNCGVIASVLTHQSSKKLQSQVPDIPKPSWERIVQHHCPVTGLSENFVIRSMQEAGMTPLDIVQLEKLSNPKVVERMRLTRKITQSRQVGERTETRMKQVPQSFWQRLTCQPIVKREVSRQVPVMEYSEVEQPISPTKDNKSHTIAYMRAWAELLTEEGQEDVAAQPQSTLPSSILP
jgi:hypothetical protein